MSVELRDAARRDAEPLLAAYEWLFEPPGRRPPGYSLEAARERLLEAIDSDQAAVLIASDDGEVVGFATVYLTMRSVRFGQRAWVEDLAVDPQRRSEGLGARLLGAARAWAAAAGAATLELESAEGRTGAHRFYERQQPGWRSNAYGWALRRVRG